MKAFRDPSEKIFCPMCRLERKVRTGPSSTWPMILLLLITASVAVYTLTGNIDGRVILFWISLIALGEIIGLIMNRISLICQYCGFDPILYKRNQTLAMTRVKETLEKSKKEFQEHPLKKNAYSHLIAHLRAKRKGRPKTFEFETPKGYLQRHEQPDAANTGDHSDVQREGKHLAAGAGDLKEI